MSAKLPYTAIKEVETIVASLRQYENRTLKNGEIILKFLILPYYDNLSDYYNFRRMYDVREWEEDGIIEEILNEETIFTIFVQYKKTFPSF